MSQLKTSANKNNVDEFINNVRDATKQKDCFKILAILKKITNSEPQMWGENIIGFGEYQYKYKSGKEIEWFLTGFSPRKQNLTIYIMTGTKSIESLLYNLGNCKVSKACLYIKKLEDINISVLKKIIKESIRILTK